MIDKDINEKPFVLKKSPFTAKEIAGVVDCSESLVKKVITGVRDGSTEKGKRILIADHLLMVGSNALLESVKNILKPL